MKGLRKILRISWIAKKTNKWVLNKAGVKRELLDTVKARKLAYYGHTMRKLELPGERDNARNNARCTQARKATHGLDGQHQDVDRTVRERVNQRTGTNGESTSMVWPTIGSRTAKEENGTECAARRSAAKTRTANVDATRYPPIDEGHRRSRVRRDRAATETPSSLACTRCVQKNAASEDWPACQ